MGNAAGKEISKFPFYNLLCVVLFLVTISQPLYILFQNKEAFFAKGYMDLYEQYHNLYNSSQYVQKENPGIIPDEALEAFAAGTFLKGLNPILIVHDQPPLGRYILSLSILLFDNVNTIIVLLFFLSGMGVFLIARLILHNTLLSFVPLAIFINEPLFVNKFYYSPLLEPIQLPFIIFAIYFFMQGIIKKNYFKWFIYTSVMLGFVISIRFFILGVLLVFTMVLYFLIKKKFDKKFALFILSLPIAAIILLVSYTRTIQLGSSILQIFGIQKYIFYYHRAQLSLPFSFWDLLFFNRWHTWWGERTIISDPQWIFIWPFSAFLALFFSLLGFFRKISVSEPEKVIVIWIIVYSLFLSLGETSTRYFPPLLPFVYIIATSFLVKIILLLKSKFKSK
ncbi:MAG: glycosyltransferase family 39 protein [Candidatus Levybacteria bacterium]|nr:glycosyltransferase family 39 protein [Candidatus Levybacteria bacterium]